MYVCMYNYYIYSYVCIHVHIHVNEESFYKLITHTYIHNNITGCHNMKRHNLGIR